MTISVGAAGQNLNAALDDFRGRIEAVVFRDDLPILGAGYADAAQDVLSFVDDLKTQVQTALSAIGKAKATAQEIADAINLETVPGVPDFPGLSAAVVGGNLSVTVTNQTLLNFGVDAAPLDLGSLDDGFDLRADLDLTAEAETSLTLVVDATTGTVSIDDSATVGEFKMELTGGFGADIAARLGFLGVDLSGPGAAEPINLNFDYDYITATRGAASVDGDILFSRELTTDPATSDVLPSISGLLELGFGFEAAVLRGVGEVEVGAEIALKDLQLDPGDLVDLLQDTLGEVLAITDIFPLGTVIDILTTPIPVLSEIAPRSLENTGDDPKKITALDLVLEKKSNGESLGFLIAVERIVELLDTLGDFLEEFDGDAIDLGSIELSAEATASFGDSLDLDAAGVSLPEVADVLGALSGTGLGAFLTGELPDEISASDRLRVPLLEDPVQVAAGILLNGFFSEPVTLIEYDLPPLGVSVRPSVPFSVGPVAFSVGGRFSAELDFGIGYDTEGFSFGALSPLDGFFVSTGRDGDEDPFLTLGFGMEVSGGVSAGVARVSAVGGVGGELGMFLAGSGTKTRWNDIQGCVFDEIEGKIKASLEIEVKIGIGKLSATERIKIGEVTLATFNIDPCDPQEKPPTEDFRYENTGLASVQSGAVLLLHVGPEGGSRTVPGDIDAQTDEVTGTPPTDPQGNPLPIIPIVDEVFSVSRDPLDPENRELLAVSAFGIYEVYTQAGGFDLIEGDGGAGRDSLTVSSSLDVAVAFDGGGASDFLQGGAEADSIEGGNGADTLIGNSGNDTLWGEAGDDLLRGGLGADSIRGGSGLDEADYSDSFEGVSFTIVPGNVLMEGSGGTAEGDVVAGIEYFRGSAFDDLLRAFTTLGTGQVDGSPSDQFGSTLDGGDGNDTLVGGLFRDLLVGGAGADDLQGNSGIDTTSYAFSEAGVSIDLFRGIVSGGHATGDTLNSIEHYHLTLLNDVFIGDDVAVSVWSFDGDDILTGSTASGDLLSAGSGADTIFGSATPNALGGGDTLNGGGNIVEGVGADAARDLLSYVLVTGVGMDVSLQTGMVSVFGLSAQTDTLAFSKSVDEDGTETDIAGDSSFEDLTGSNQDDALEGDNQDNLIRGLAGNDVLRGLQGEDTLIGGGGADDHQGGTGEDWADYTDSNAGVTVDLSAGTGSGGHAQGDTFSAMESIIGTPFDDVLTGNLSANTLDPGLYSGGFDDLDGKLGVDTLQLNWAESFDDLDFIKTTADDGEIRIGGTQTDVLELTEIELVNATFGIGNDRVLSNGQSEPQDDPLVDFFPTADFLNMGLGDDTVNAGAGADYILMGGGNDEAARTKATVAQTFYIDGGAGIDVLRADFSYDTTGITLQSFSDTEENTTGGASIEGGGYVTRFELFPEITTGSGSDELVQLGHVDNSFFTGDGGDLVVLDYGFNEVDAGESEQRIGIDRVFVDIDTLVLDYSAENELFLLTDLSEPHEEDTYRIYQLGRDSTGNNVPDLTEYAGEYFNFERVIISGTQRTDIIWGLSPDEDDLSFGDWIDGQGGNDILRGEEGNDTLIGGEGSDILRGGAGNDDLTGGVFGVADGIDVIFSFTGSDTIRLGDVEGVFYGAPEGGTNDHAILRDFDTASDRLVLHGRFEDYVVTTDGTDSSLLLADGLALVAVLQGVTGLDLTADYVDYARPVRFGSAALDDVVIGGGGGFPGGPGLNALASNNDEPFEVFAGNFLDPLEALLVGGYAKVADSPVTLLDFDFTGPATSIGNFINGPIGIDRGLVLSTGDPTALPGENTADGSEAIGAIQGSDAVLDFVRLGTTAGGSVIFGADLSLFGGDLSSLTLTDSGNREGADKLFSGFDLDGVFLSREELTPTSDPIDMATVSTLDVFDFSPGGTTLTEGTIRNPDALFELAGTVNGMVNVPFARLGEADYDGNALNGGAVSLGDGGSIRFDLTETVSTVEPLYLYVAEAFDAGETLSALVSATDASTESSADLSTDLGVAGAEGDDVSLSAVFDVDLSAGIDSGSEATLFNLVIVSEELPEFGGKALQDIVDVRVNGLSAVVLGDGRQATLNNLSNLPFGASADELIFNPVGTGPLADVLKADAYTTVIPVRAPVLDGINLLTLRVADAGDGLRDTAVFIAANVDQELVGDSGPDSLVGGDGNDTITGGGGNDTLNGELGDDIVAGGAGDDIVDGRAGNDTVTGGNGKDEVEGGLDDDLVEGGDGMDTLRGGSGNDTMLGGEGDDSLLGGDGDDSGEGGEGNDTIDGGEGDDTMLGGDGNDVINDFTNGADSLDGGFGGDTINGGEDNDTLIGGPGWDSLDGSDDDDLLLGGNGKDTLDGGEGQDTLDGGKTDDTLFGGSGNDLLIGGGGGDSLDGGLGADTLQGDADGDTLIGGDGWDDVFGASGSDMIEGGEGKDTLRGEGGFDTIFGDGGADVLLGGRGNDELNGGDRNDVLRGWRGNDDLDGGRGNDVLDGQGNDDVLTGGAGADRFIFQARHGRDVITDFTAAGSGAGPLEWDVLRFVPGTGGPTSRAEFVAASTQQGINLFFDLGNDNRNTILLVGVDANELTDANFDFG